jgi:hypothetical protein
MNLNSNVIEILIYDPAHKKGRGTILLWLYWHTHWLTPWNRSLFRVNSRLGGQNFTAWFSYRDPVTNPCSYTHRSSTQSLRPFLEVHFSIIILSKPRSPKLFLFFSRFRTENLHVSSPIRATCPAYLSSSIWSSLYYLVKITNYILNEGLYMKESWCRYCETW